MADFNLSGGLAAPSLDANQKQSRSVVASPKAPQSEFELPNTLSKAPSASHLPTMAVAGTVSRGRNLFESDSNYLNTLPDPRTPSPAPRTPSTDSQHSDLSNEVAMLSTKLINAINHQTNLDDTLQHTRQELDAAKRSMAEYESRIREHARLVSTGVLVKKSQADASVDAMRKELVEAQKQRDIAEKGRKEMEVELETLTSALFEEANTMVAAARKESEATERKNAQLRSQLGDTELLLASQQEQLVDLKGVMERMSSEHDETDTVPRSSTAPSTPGHEAANKMSGMFDNFPMSPNTPSFGETPPDQPLRFSHLITPVMRSDLQAYTDFAELLKTSRAAAPSHSRASSGLSYPNGNASDSSTVVSSSPIIPGSFSSASTSSPREPSYASSLPPLKDNKFYKRCLVEDIEPALRLDLAPGLSWLARRTVIGAITGGTLVVEPFIPHSKFYNTVYACSLCGESRRNEAYARKHRFRTSEDDGAQRYPLCEYCLGRIRATCDFLGFLRMVRDGLWRAQTDDDINGAWEESVRLREKMFWARLGGGVVPAVSARTDSPTVTQQRRAHGGLLRRTSSNSTNATRISREDGARSSMDSQRQTLGVPKIRDPFKSSPQKENTPANNSSDTSDLHDFATVALKQTEAPSTPINEPEETLQAKLDGSSTPQLQTHTSQIDGQVESSGHQGTGDGVFQTDDKSSEKTEPPTSTIPGSFD